jgi:micrococcal nuclease
LLVARISCTQAPLDTTAPLAEGDYRVVRVVDGDTIIVAPHTRIRLIGVDTPETVKPEHPVEPFGPEATRFSKDFLAGGTARLTFDRERLDRFGRHLAYVWVDDRMLNEELIRAGLGRYEPHFHYSQAMKRRFREAQREAREAHRGIWSQMVPAVP